MDNQKHNNKKIAIIIIGVILVVGIALLLKKGDVINIGNNTNGQFSESEKAQIREQLRQSAASQPQLTAEQKAKAVENIKKSNTSSVSLTAEQKASITEELKKKY